MVRVPTVSTEGRYPERMHNDNDDLVKEYEFIRRLCPHLSVDEMRDADFGFEGYVDLLTAIARRREREETIGGCPHDEPAE